MHPHELTYTNPRHHLTPVRETITDPLQVLARLHELNTNLSAVLDHPLGACVVDAHGNGLAIALAGETWALTFSYMANDELVDQIRSVGPTTSPEGSIGIYFDQYTDIPISWFIPRAEAEVAIRYWLQTGLTEPSMAWSHDTH